MNTGEACNRTVIVTEPQTPIQAAAQLMREYHVGDLVVVEKRNGDALPVGILSDRDIVLEVIAEGVSLDAVSVRDVMSFELLTLNEDEDWVEGCKRMRQRGVRRAPVVDRKGALIGILSVDDILDLVAEELADLAGLVSKEQAREQDTRGRP